MNDSIYAVVIDDDETFLSSFEILLKTEFPEISLIGTARSVKSGIELINKVKPQLVFLDINLPDGMGFEILESIGNCKFEVIFTTAYTKYAVRAFEFSALHYIIKPINVEKLKEAVKRYHTKTNGDLFKSQLAILRESILEHPQKIILPEIGKKKIYNIADIIFCEAEGSYTNIHLVDTKNSVMVTKTLSSLEKSLEEADFVRIHNKFLVNLKYIKYYKPGKNPELTLQNGKELSISQTHQPKFLEELAKYTKTP